VAETTAIPIHTCVCGKQSDVATHMDKVPKPGDIAYCGELTVFDEDMTQRALSAGEFEALKAGPHWEQIEAAQTHFRIGGYDS
jgi:hypothetical protein